MLAIDWDRLPLGKVPDLRLARELKCSTGVVRYQRERRQISPYCSRPPALLLTEVWEHISRFTPRSVPEIHRRVCEDVGEVSIRTVYRCLAKLRDKLIREEHGWLRKR